MFRLEIFVQKKYLADVFERLTGIADVQTCAMVPNLEVKPNGKIYQTSADTLEMLSKEVHKLGKPTIRGPEVRAIITRVGMNPTSYSHFINSMINAGLLKKIKKDGTAMIYQVTGK